MFFLQIFKHSVADALPYNISPDNQNGLQKKAKLKSYSEFGSHLLECPTTDQIMDESEAKIFNFRQSAVMSASIFHSRFERSTFIWLGIQMFKNTAKRY